MNIADPRIRLMTPIETYKDYPHLASVTALMTRHGVSPDYSKMQFINQTTLAAKASRGTHAHSITEQFDKGILGEVPDGMQGFADGWAKFREDSGFTPTIIEAKAANLIHGYVGTMDRAGTISIPYHTFNRKGDGVVVQGWTVIDIKTGQEFAYHGIQMAAYSGLLLDGMAYNRMALYLPGDGSYKPVIFDDPADYSVWLAITTIENWNHRGKK